jgi:hypothetical protein
VLAISERSRCNRPLGDKKNLADRRLKQRRGNDRQVDTANTDPGVDLYTVPD